LRDRVALFVAVAVHVNVAVNETSTTTDAPHPLTNFSFGAPF
jgi:hypothetical protein